MLQKEIIGPAIEGTKYVLMAAKELGVRRVVITSSTAAIVPNHNWPADMVKNEDCWTDVEYCKQNKVHSLSLLWTSNNAASFPF